MEDAFKGGLFELVWVAKVTFTDAQCKLDYRRLHAGRTKPMGLYAQMAVREVYES